MDKKVSPHHHNHQMMRIGCSLLMSIVYILYCFLNNAYRFYKTIPPIHFLYIQEYINICHPTYWHLIPRGAIMNITTDSHNLFAAKEGDFYEDNTRQKYFSFGSGGAQAAAYLVCAAPFRRILHGHLVIYAGHCFLS